MFTRFAYAKINLTLDILGRRPDGYHEIASVMQAISLHDTLVFSKGPGLCVECSDRRLAGPDNLVHRAAELLRREMGGVQGARVRLTKRIPLAAGLGGGSSDAACALLGLNALWRLGLGQERLAELASRLGSDVPFFLTGGTALVQGRGERVTPLPPPAPAWLVLAVQPVGVSAKTRTLYEALQPGDYTDGSATRRMVEDIERQGRIDPRLTFNAFEPLAFRLFPELERVRTAMLEAGASLVRLSGSGPAMFTIVPDRRTAHALRRRLAAGGVEAIAASY
ncbi:MAG: 4-(cytidine 5'-diphospho)-2-C-methyl-D-erythritol kinase [Chloroflexota bacterium]